MISIGSSDNFNGFKLLGISMLRFSEGKSCVECSVVGEKVSDLFVGRLGWLC